MSHILNGHTGKYSSETEAKVRRAAAELDYTPSVARVLVRGRSDLVVIILPFATLGARLQETLETISETARELGLLVLTWFPVTRDETPVGVLKYLRPAAVIDVAALSDVDRDRIIDLNIPLVSNGHWTHGDLSPSVDETIGEAQVQLLSGRRVVYVHLADAHKWSAVSANRERAVRAACARRGLPEPVVIESGLSLSEARAALSAIPETGPLGLACYNDEVATAMLAGARSLGRRVPDDIAVVGVDATPLGQLLDPPLTSVYVDPSVGLVSIASELKAALARSQVEPPELTYTATVIVGGTT